MADYDLTGITLPYNPEAEMSVIGAIVAKSEVFSDVNATLHKEHFYSEVNSEVYAIVNNMFMSNQKIDILTVADECVRQGVFENGSEAKRYLGEAVECVPSFSSAATYARIITEKYMLRSLIFASKEIIDAANNSTEQADKLVDFAEQKIYNIRSGVENRTLTRISGIVYDRLKALSDLVHESEMNGGKPVMTGLATGFKELDKRIFGLNPSDLIILAARPGMGKTSFAMNIATQVSKLHRSKQVCVFSLEMSKEQIVSRILSSEALLPSDAMKTGRLSPNQLTSVYKSAEVLQELEVYIDDTPGANVASIKSKLRRMKNLGVVIIDYLQLMSSTESYSGNRVAQVSEITRNLKIMAKEMNVTVIALSQLARGPEQRPDKRPMLSDLRDSGSIEQDADIVLFLYRNSYYDKTDPNQNVCECIVAKNRHGETGTAMLGWKGEFTKFTNAEFHREEQH